MWLSSAGSLALPEWAEAHGDRDPDRQFRSIARDTVLNREVEKPSRSKRHGGAEGDNTDVLARAVLNCSRHVAVAFELLIQNDSQRRCRACRQGRAHHRADPVAGCYPGLLKGFVVVGTAEKHERILAFRSKQRKHHIVETC